MQRLALLLVLAAGSVAQAADLDILGSWKFDPTRVGAIASETLCFDLLPGGRFVYVVEPIDGEAPHRFSVRGRYEMADGILTLRPDEGPAKLEVWTTAVSRDGANLVFGAGGEFPIRFEPTPWCPGNSWR